MCVLVASPRVMGESVRAWRKRKGEGIRQACLQPNLLLNIELDLQIYIGFDPIFTRDSNERETDLPGNELGNGASAKNPRVCALFCLIPVRFRLSVLIFFFFSPPPSPPFHLPLLVIYYFPSIPADCMRPA